MIYCENKIGKVMLDDELNIKASNSNLKLVQTIINSLSDKIAPENGSPTYILANELKKFGFKIIDVELPAIEQIENIVF